MSLRSRYSVSFLLWTIGLFSAVGAGAQGEVPARLSLSPGWLGVRIVDYRQWSYEDVGLNWADGGETLLVRRPDGAIKSFRPDEILYVFAANGRDITAEVAAARPAVRSPGGKAEMGTGSGRTLEQLIRPALYKAAFDVGYGYGITVGDWYWGLGNGENYQLGLRIMLADNQYVRLAFRTQGLGTASNWLGLSADSATAVKGDLYEYQFLIGRHSAVVKEPSIRSTGYMEFGLSAMQHRLSAGPLTDSITKVGVVFQLGLWLLLSDNAALDFSTGFTWKPGFGSREDGGLVLTARVGLAVFK